MNRYLQQIPLPGLDDMRTGYRSTAVRKIVGITYRQLDHWTTTGLVRATVRDAEGSGSQRLYSFDDVVELKLIKRLLDSGMDLRKIRKALEVVREKGLSLRDITLCTDGATVYALDDSREVIDLLQSGQGVFAIAVQPVVDETEAEVRELPSERAAPLPVATDVEEPATLPAATGTDLRR